MSLIQQFKSIKQSYDTEVGFESAEIIGCVSVLNNCAIISMKWQESFKYFQHMNKFWFFEFRKEKHIKYIASELLFLQPFTSCIQWIFSKVSVAHHDLSLVNILELKWA